MSAFVPMNIPIAFGMICLPATQFNVAFFNFVNQTYNASINYANGSGSDDSVKFVAIAYSLALISSIGTGMFLNKKFNKVNSANIFTEAIIRIVPSMVAGSLNIFFMRSDYMTKGINIKDNKGNNIGLSKICGTKALFEGILTRLFLPLPLLINHFAVKALNHYSKNRRINTMLEMIFCGIALGIGLPFSIALFKQYKQVNINILEKDLQEKAKTFGSEFVLYNKGL